MNQNSKRDLVVYRISRANETLKEVEAMMDSEFWNAAVNRMYYACFYAVSAILLDKEINAQTHAGVRKMLGLYFVQTGKISRELGKFYADLFDKRQTGDYDDFISFDEETLKELLPQAIELIQHLEKLLNEK
ncbi:MAG: HEPN domain-containing protein [Saprospiraceae bacterium]